MNECDPKKIIDFDKNYYEILGIDKTSFPTGKTRESKITITRLLEKAFRQRARKCHPDFGGSKEQFLDIVRARRILEDDFLRRISSATIVLVVICLFVSKLLVPPYCFQDIVIIQLLCILFCMR